MIATTSHIITEEEYLQLEKKATVRHELINGKMYEMAWEDSEHEDVVMNIAFQLRLAKKKAVTHGLRVKNVGNNNFYYPDVLVYPATIGNVSFIVNPLLIAEVLSQSTRTKDLSDKFIAYRQFASLEYYLVIEPGICYINLFSKDENAEWQSEIYTQLTDVVLLPKLQTSLPVTDIYEGLDWAHS